MHILLIYRLPQTKKHEFVEEIYNLLCEIPVGCEVIMIGDMNIDLLYRTGSGSVNSYYTNSISELGLECAISDVTREDEDVH